MALSSGGIANSANPNQAQILAAGKHWEYVNE